MVDLYNPITRLIDVYYWMGMHTGKSFGRYCPTCKVIMIYIYMFQNKSITIIM